MTRGARQAAGGVVFVLLALYLCFPDKVYVFDGIMFSGIIERAVENWREELFNRRHLLFNPFMLLAREALRACGLEVGGYPLIQRVNAVAGTLGVFVFFSLARDLARGWKAAAVASGFLALSASYWSRATEGQVYMLMTLGALLVAWTAVRLLDQATPARAAGLCGAFAGAVLMHAANVALAPMALAAAFFAARASKDRRLWAAAPAAGALIAAAYAATHGVEALLHPANFLREATEISSLSAFASSGGLTFGARMLGVLSSLGEAFAGNTGERARLVLGVALAAAFVLTAWRALREPRAREKASLLLLWTGGCVALEAFWQGGQFFWASPAAALLALCALAWGGALEARRPATLAAVALAAALGGWNLKALIAPQSKLENNVGYARSIFVRDHTVASSWVVISGLGFPNQKVYLPYFARRSREVLEYYLTRDPKEEALERFKLFLDGNIERGIPLYLLPDLVDDETSLSGLERRWGVTPADVRAAFGPGDLIEAARQDARFRVFLFAPQRRRDRLFAVLGYSVLTESEPARLQETVFLLRALASGMSADQRRATAEVMRKTDYGSTLLMDGFLQFMGADSRRTAEERLARFAAYRQTADFHLRLGNVLRYLGQTEDVRRAWKRAYELSGDKALLQSLNSLK